MVGNFANLCAFVAMVLSALDQWFRVHLQPTALVSCMVCDGDLQFRFSKRSEGYVLIEQIKLCPQAGELHVPSATSTLNHLLSWTTVYAANSFGIQRLLPLQAHVLPLLVRPLVSYSDRVINKEKMPHLIVAVAESNMGKSWSYLLGTVDYCIRGSHFQRSPKNSYPTPPRDSNKGPKAIILLPNLELCLRISCILSQILASASIKHQRIVSHTCLHMPEIHSLLMDPPDILVSTPKILKEAIEKGLKLESVKYLICDDIFHAQNDLDVLEIVKKIPFSSKDYPFKLAVFASKFSPRLDHLAMNLGMILKQTSASVASCSYAKVSFVNQTHPRLSFLPYPCLGHMTRCLEQIQHRFIPCKNKFRTLVEEIIQIFDLNQTALVLVKTKLEAQNLREILHATHNKSQCVVLNLEQDVVFDLRKFSDKQTVLINYHLPESLDHYYWNMMAFVTPLIQNMDGTVKISISKGSRLRSAPTSVISLYTIREQAQCALLQSSL